MKKYRAFQLKYLLLVFCLLFLSLYGMACDKKPKENTIMIAEQYGLAYAPLQIMKEKGFLEEQLPDVKVEWIQLSNTAAIREAVLAEDLDIGFMGIPPFIIGVDNGMDWRIFSALSQSPVGLVTNKKDIINLSDIKENDKIALPQPGSIQHILLAMSCEKQLGQADAFDNRIISMNHPDGFQALMAGAEISGHYTSPPYLFEELKDPDNHLVVSGKEAVGEEFTFIAGVCTEAFFKKETLLDAVKNAITASIEYMEEHPEETDSILSKEYGIEKELIKEYLNNDDMVYTTELKGVSQLADFMYRNNYIKQQYEMEDLIWE